MLSYCVFDQEISSEAICASTTMHKYAWLEHEGGMWHFLTDLFADPVKSTRRWSDKQLALEELVREGWSIVYPYPEKLPMQPQPSEKIFGYGLMWIDQ
jgi:hypothetical protein